MEVRHAYDNDYAPFYYVKEKIDNQTFYMEFSELEKKRDSIVFNIAAGVCNKRKKLEWLMDSNKVTGKSPFKTISTGLKAYKMLEDEILNIYNRHRDVIFLVYWTDNRRRDAYYKVLKKKGYDFFNSEYGKCLRKKVAAGTYKKEGEWLYG